MSVQAGVALDLDRMRSESYKTRASISGRRRLNLKKYNVKKTSYMCGVKESCT